MEKKKIVHEFDSLFSAELWATVLKASANAAKIDQSIRMHSIGSKVFVVLEEGRQPPSKGPRGDVPPPVGPCPIGPDAIYECPVCRDEVVGEYDTVSNHIYQEHCDSSLDICEEFNEQIGGPVFSHLEDEEQDCACTYCGKLPCKCDEYMATYEKF